MPVPPKRDAASTGTAKVPERARLDTPILRFAGDPWEWSGLVAERFDFLVMQPTSAELAVWLGRRQRSIMNLLSSSLDRAAARIELSESRAQRQALSLILLQHAVRLQGEAGPTDEGASLARIVLRRGLRKEVEKLDGYRADYGAINDELNRQVDRTRKSGADGSASDAGEAGGITKTVLEQAVALATQGSRRIDLPTSTVLGVAHVDAPLQPPTSLRTYSPQASYGDGTESKGADLPIASRGDEVPTPPQKSAAKRILFRTRRPVLAPVSGKVEYADGLRGLGQVVVIQREGATQGAESFILSNLSTVEVKAGQTVAAGQAVGWPEASGSAYRIVVHGRLGATDMDPTRLLDGQPLAAIVGGDVPE